MLHEAERLLREAEGMSMSMARQQLQGGRRQRQQMQQGSKAAGVAGLDAGAYACLMARYERRIAACLAAQRMACR